MVSGRVARKLCLGCISETVRCRKLVLRRDISWGCNCATLWCDLDLSFDLAVVTFTLKFCLDYISETVMCRKLILSGHIGWGVGVPVKV